MMRILSVALGLILAGNAMAESKGLSDIYNLAVANDPSLRAQIATRDAALASTEGFESRRGPTVSASISSAQTDNAMTNEDSVLNTASVTVSMPVYDRALNKQIEGARYSSSAAGAVLNTARQSHIVTVSQAYFDVLSAERDLAAAQAEVQALEKQLEQASERLAVGIGTRVDVDQARAQLDLSKVSLIASEVDVEAKRADLKRLVDADFTVLKNLSDDFEASIHRELDSNLDVLVDSHPTVIEKTNAFQAAVAKLDEARGERWPSLSLSSTYKVSETENSASSDGLTSQQNLLTLTMSVPIYGSATGSLSAAIEKAYADMVVAESRLEESRREVRRDVTIASRNLEASARTVEARRLAIVSAASRVEATEAAYAVGSGDIVEVLNAKKDLFAAERDFAKARHTHVIRQLEFDQAIGDLSESAITRIDQYLVQ
jgi:outer membrane protein